MANEHYEPLDSSGWVPKPRPPWKPGKIEVIPSDDPRYWTYIISTGWECPRCQRVNNPSLDQCPCKPIKPTTIPKVPGTAAEIDPEGGIMYYVPGEQDDEER